MSAPLTYKEIVLKIGQWLMSNYWGPIHQAVKANPELLRTIPGFLLKPERLIYYMSRHHIGIEYQGPERIDNLPSGGFLEASVFDYSKKDCHILDEIVGFDFGDGAFRLPLAPITNDLVLPTNAGADELIRLNWNWSAQNMMLGFNIAGFEVPKDQFTRVVNARFFDSTAKDGLRTRHIKWLDLIPCSYDDSGNDTDTFDVWLDPYLELAKLDVCSTYPLPSDFRLNRLQQMNRFLEFIGDKNNDEPAITRLLSSDELQFALKMRFSAKAIHAECLCEWQSEDRKPIRPDFFVVGPDGYAEIVEPKSGTYPDA